MNFQPYYVLISSKQQRQRIRLQLPATIGSNADDDIILNAASLDASAYLLSAAADELVFTHLATNQRTDGEQFKKFGLELAGPIFGQATKGRSLRQKIRELLSLEKSWTKNRSKLFQKILLVNCSQSLRFLSFSAMVALSGYFLFGYPANPPQDLSKEPVVLTFDALFSETIGASKKRFGYENGITLALDAPESVRKQSTLLSLDAGGLNFGEELKFVVKDKVVFATEADPNCSEEICTLQIPLALGVIAPGLNVITILHEPRESSYLIKNIHLLPTPVITELEIEKIEHLYTLAQRAYEDRELVPENLVSSQYDLKKALALLDSRQRSKGLTEELRNKIIVLAHESFAKDFWSKAEVATKLQNYQEAEKQLALLQRLFPDPLSEQYKLAQAKLDAIKEIQP
jgi:hypothetical protein